MTASNIIVYFGSYTRPHPSLPTASGAGLVVCGFDSRTGKLEQRQVVGEVLNPSYLALDDTGAHLFAVSEDFDESGAVHCFGRGGDGRLTPMGVQSSRGLATCHVCTVPGGLVVASSYIDGVLAVCRFADGVLHPAEKLFRYNGSSVNVARQESSHAHQSVVSPDARWLYVCDLGADRIWCHLIEADTIAAASADSVATPAGSGPRHLVFHPTLPRVYVLCELNAHLLTYGWDARSGRLTLVDDQPTLPTDWPGQPSAAAIRLHPFAATLYVSNRNHDSLAAFRLDRDGTPEFAGRVGAGGKKPRDFAIDPSGRWLLAANQDSNCVAVHELDSQDGLFTGREPEIVSMGTPVCVLFAGSPPNPPQLA